ncbi:phosphomethylpyrimidine synthase ThiC [Desulfatibacillum aliphaticivorans]|uniref:phosphomethylpyrimidine synthase ThiC n=1 Tax=Desulfatibacillum aliphaticivorans TaxID=218208 RepID=UPI000403DD20|nr:phosphomethylpyrimidine synthase ThiC [Desulfatibacillum aliphaticivorans]
MEKTQVQWAVEGRVTPVMEEIAAKEGVAASEIREHFAQGRIVCPQNANRPCRNVGIGMGLSTKINASIGTSTDISNIDFEVAKAKAAQEAGADTLMELSVGGDLDKVRREVLAAVDLPVGNVPLYQAFCEAAEKYGDPNKLDSDMLFDIIERQCADGISFMAVHCGINLYTIERLEKQGYRYGGLVSKGGASMVAWMKTNKRENPLYEEFDRVAAILKKYDVVLSLGNGLRAGAVADSFDRAMVQELLTNCELAELGRKMGCQMMVEGPGHVPMDEIEANIILQKRMSNNAPYYMLGPLPTDAGAGYDHVVAAIGASQSARYGADLICYITPAEHLALPNVDDVVEGVKVARLAAHIGDMGKLPEKTRMRDMDMSRARRDMDWEGQFANALFPEDARKIRDDRSPSCDDKVCTMCGEFCANRASGKLFNEALSAGVKG